MNSLADITAALLLALALQEEKTEAWHGEQPGEALSLPEHEAEMVDPLPESGPDRLPGVILHQHLCNYRLWHIEDCARRVDVSDSEIAACKRAIDRQNQQRNDLMEQIDQCLAQLLSPLLPTHSADLRNTETPGMAVDRLSILALKIYHMREETLRHDVEEAHRERCGQKLAVLQDQRKALVSALRHLLQEYVAGTKRPALFFQFKMYNDPSLNPELYRNSSRK